MFTQETWFFISPNLSSTNLTELFEIYATETLDTFCPIKRIVERPGENPFMREDMKKLKRKLMREYEKRGKSDLYFYLKNDLDEKVKSEKLKYKNKVIEEVKTGSRSSSYAAIKKLGAHPTDLIKGFTLPCC